MWWRAPWLQQRWTLLRLAIFDAAIIVGAYNVLFWHRFDRWAGVTGSVSATTTLWLALSYVLGRYSEGDRGRSTRAKRIWTAAITAIVVLVTIVVFAIWGLQSKDPRSFRSFIMPVLGISFTGSVLAQELGTRTPKPRHWKIVARDEDISMLGMALELHSTGTNISLTFGNSLENEEDSNENEGLKRGIAVDERVKISERVIEKMLELKRTGVLVCDLIAWCEDTLHRIPPELLSTRTLVLAQGFHLQPGTLTWRIKRGVDLTLASLLLAAALPVITICSVIIWLEDRGPVLYSQKRTGLYGEQFTIWKLRTMRVNSENGVPQWSKRGDKRITGIGYWLRLSRIDELPQLLSVIKGEMSLIGPRPERPEIEEVLEKQIPHYRVRHWVRPGLSGWAQVCYPYGASLEDSKNKLSYDLFYLRNASISLDLLILAKTMRLVCRAEGALAIAK